MVVGVDGTQRAADLGGVWVKLNLRRERKGKMKRVFHFVLET